MFWPAGACGQNLTLDVTKLDTRNEPRAWGGVGRFKREGAKLAKSAKEAAC